MDTTATSLSSFIRPARHQAVYEVHASSSSADDMNVTQAPSGSEHGLEQRFRRERLALAVRIATPLLPVEVSTCRLSGRTTSRTEPLRTSLM